LAPIRQPRTLLDEAVELAVLELQGAQLGYLVTQQFQLRLAVARLALQLQGPIQQSEPHAMRDSNLPDRRLETPVLIEQLALRGWPCQGLELVLAVYVDQDVAQLAQQLHRDRLTVQICARAPVVGHHAADRELIGGRDGLLLQPALQLSRRAAEVERAGD